MTHKKIITIITAVTGDRVILTDEAVRHVIDVHFRGIPQAIILETVERVLKDPSELYKDSTHKNKEYDFFYRLESGEFLVAVVKIIPNDGAYLSSMYPTGKRHRNKHKKLKKVRI